MNKKILTALMVSACALGVSAADAYAQTSRIYFAGYLGLKKTGDLEFTRASSGTGGGDLTSKNALSFAGALGLRMSRNLRIEAELSYDSSDFSRADISSGPVDLGGNLSSTLGFLNVYYDFDTQWKFQPYIGGGLGLIYAEGDIVDASAQIGNHEDTDIGFAWNIGGGLKYRASPNMAVTGGYRYLDTVDLEFGDLEIDYGAHEFRVGVEYDLPYGRQRSRRR